MPARRLTTDSCGTPLMPTGRVVSVRTGKYQTEARRTNLEIAKERVDDEVDSNGWTENHIDEGHEAQATPESEPNEQEGNA